MKNYSASFVHRVPKTQNNEHGCVNVDTIPVDTKCLVIFGGENTRTAKTANYYMSCFERIVGTGVGIYSVIYNINNRLTSMDERARIRKSIRKNAIKPKDIPDASYILFQQLMLPRIADNCKKIEYKEVLRRIQNLTLYAHCHGSVILYHFQQMLFNSMRNLGYTKRQTLEAMRHLCVVQHAPVVPLAKNKFSTLSFMSATDSFMKKYNILPKWLIANAKDLTPSFFPKRYGNCIVASEISYQTWFDHTIEGFDFPDMMTFDGHILFDAETQAITNCINRTKVLQPKDMINGSIADFDTLCDNGARFYQQIQSINLNLRHAQNQSRAHQK
ncbi:MAG: hypothetical protein KBS86_03945 [Proteobacteria bacterium]|nr:hypothetical protein [Candidatus Enterousia scatequi]